MSIRPRTESHGAFFHWLRHLGYRSGASFFIGMRGDTDLRPFSAMANITIFPSKWLYTSEGFDRVVDMPKCRGTDIIHVRNAHTMAPKISASVIAALFSLPTDGRAMVIAEQNVALLSGHVDRMIGMHAGRIRGDVGHLGLE